MAVGSNIGHRFTLESCNCGKNPNREGLILRCEGKCGCQKKGRKCNPYCHVFCHHFCKNCPKRLTCQIYNQEEEVTRKVNEAVELAIDQTCSYMRHLISGLQMDQVKDVIKKAQEKMNGELEKLNKESNE
jgi:hypothetical protein